MVGKRKAVTRDSPEADRVLLSDGLVDLDSDLLDGVVSQSEDGGSEASQGLEIFSESEDDNDGDSEEQDGSFDEEDDTDRSLLNGREEPKGTKSRTQDEGQLDDDSPNYTLDKDANGSLRFVYRPIDPAYDSDDSDAPATTNTIGNIPLSFYESYPHIGYDIQGKKIARPAAGAALDQLLDSIEIPKGWTNMTDPETGKPLELSQEELEVLKKLQLNEVPVDGFDPYPATIEYFTGIEEQMPLSAAPEPKRRFVPSKHEAKRVMKVVKAIQEGRILPYKPPAEEEEEDPDVKRYDIWKDETPRTDHAMHIPAPKLPPPGYDESYHPPQEYLPDAAERKAWEEADEEDRSKEYLPANYDSLRKVPGYSRLVKEKFERCLDLYLAPRVRRNKLDIDPESLLPKLPSPEELRPFPTVCSAVYHGHEGRVRSVSIDPTGIWLASGGDDGTVKIWELRCARPVWSLKLGGDEPVHVVRWRPGKDACILAAAHGEDMYLVVPSIPDLSEALQATSHELLDAGWGYATSSSSTTTAAKPSLLPWSRPPASLLTAGALIKTTLRTPIKHIAWHRRGDYLSTVSPKAQSSSVAIHTLSKHLTQLPFRRLKGEPQASLFHPSKPLFYVATMRLVRAYDLSRQEALNPIQPGARYISSIDLHPGGDNLLVGAYDKRLLWHDLDLSPRPYKTLRYHKKAIRAVRFHPRGFPLFADASDDGTVQIFHGKVVDDLMENANIVPLKVLRGHKVVGQLGVLDLDWCAGKPWCVSAGADGTCRLWC